VAAVRTVTVGVYGHVDGLKRAIRTELAELPELALSVEEQWRGRRLYLCVDAGGRAEEGEVRRRLALALAEHILADLEPGLLARILGQNYGHFAREERDSILAYADKHLAAGGETAARVRRKSEILSRLLDYLEAAGEVNLEGFIRFRLKDYLEELEEAVDHAIDDFLLEREYREFVRLLRYFVDAQTPRMGVAHVVFGRDGHFRIFDEGAREVESQALRQFVVETLESDVAYEDLLVSALITLAPRSVRVHDRFGEADRESVETVTEVFEGRIEFCSGCALCRSRRTQRHPAH
jgi:putative sporulation protein YtxC